MCRGGEGNWVFEHWISAVSTPKEVHYIFTKWVVIKRGLPVYNRVWWPPYHVISELLCTFFRILTIMEQIGFKMNFNGRNESVIFPRLALAVLRPDPMNFQGVAFGIVSYTLETSPQVRHLLTLGFSPPLYHLFLPDTSWINLKSTLDLFPYSSASSQHPSRMFRPQYICQDRWEIT